MGRSVRAASRERHRGAAARVAHREDHVSRASVLTGTAFAVASLSNVAHAAPDDRLGLVPERTPVVVVLLVLFLATILAGPVLLLAVRCLAPVLPGLRRFARRGTSARRWRRVIVT
jgi:hypothetical protein